MEKDLFTPDRKLMTDKNQDSTKVQTGASIVLLVLFFRKDMTKTAVSPKAHCTIGDPSPKLKTWSTLQKFQATECPFW